MSCTRLDEIALLANSLANCARNPTGSAPNRGVTELLEARPEERIGELLVALRLPLSTSSPRPLEAGNATWQLGQASAEREATASCSPAGVAGPLPSLAGAVTPLRRSAAACLRASFFACLRSRRSRTAFSRLRFAIVVFFLELEPMLIPSGRGSAQPWS